VLDRKESRTWWPNEHEMTRMVCMTRDNDHYPYCRHYTKTGARTFDCTKSGNQRTTCAGCMTCPNCGGMMFTCGLTQAAHRDRIFITHTKSCTICGAYIEERYVMATRPQEQEQEQKQDPEQEEAVRCQVEGCPHTAYEGYTYRTEFPNDKQFIICITHKRRIKSWRQNPDKGYEQRPMIISSGRLCDNPEYDKKRRKKNDQHHCSGPA
jgi:hypothetical protein